MHGEQRRVHLRSPPDGESLNTLAAEIRQRIQNVQRGVGTFFDDAVLELLVQVGRLDPAATWRKGIAEFKGPDSDRLRRGFQRLLRYVARRNQGRFVEFDNRLRRTHHGPQSHCDIGNWEFAMSQGTTQCMHWRGIPLFKSVYDVSLYSMMLWDIKPATIFELGSGAGGSAIFLADLTRNFGTNATVYSVDISEPAVRHESVVFLQSDCSFSLSVFDDERLRNAPHPWLIIEDMHVNVYGVLNYFHPWCAKGDYIVVEDSGGKKDEIVRFLSSHPGSYKVDTLYTDFFGQNATCAQDSIFVRMR